MIVQTQTASFLAQLFSATHDFTGDTFKLALYTSAAELNAATTVYSATGEATGGDYVAGGKAVTGVTVVAHSAGAYIDFDDVAWTGAITARGGLLYNASKANKAVAVLDFGADKTSTNTFTVTLPSASATTALLRNTLQA